MADDDGTHIEIDLPPEVDEPVVETPAPVTVVETGGADDNTALIASQAERIALLERDLEDARSAAATAASTAQSAEAVADMALAETGEVVAEVAELIAEVQAEQQAPATEDVEPNRKHWFWR